MEIFDNLYSENTASIFHLIPLFFYPSATSITIIKLNPTGSAAPDTHLQETPLPSPSALRGMEIMAPSGKF